MWTWVPTVAMILSSEAPLISSVPMMKVDTRMAIRPYSIVV